MTGIYYTPAAALSHDGCGGFLSTITNKVIYMTKLIKDPKTGLTRPSRKIAAKIREIPESEISAMIKRIAWRKKKLKQYGKNDTFNPSELNPDYTYTPEPARAAEYWNEGRMIG